MLSTVLNRVHEGKYHGVELGEIKAKKKRTQDKDNANVS